MTSLTTKDDQTKTNAKTDKLIYRHKLDGKDVPDYIAEIKEATAGVTKQWIKLAKIFLAAKKDLSKESYKVLKDNCDLCPSTIHKLIRVASDDFLRKNEKTLNQVQNWVVLYEITHLTVEQQNTMLEKFFGKDKANHVKLKDIRALRDNKEPAKNEGSPLLQVRIDTKGINDPAKVKACELEVAELISDVGKSYGFDLSLQSFDLDEKLSDKIDRETEREFAKETRDYEKAKRKVVRDFYNNQLSTFDKPNLSNGNFSKARQFQKMWGVCREEVFDRNMTDYMFEHFDLEPILRSGEQHR